MSFTNLFANPIGIYNNTSHHLIEESLTDKFLNIKKENKSGGKDWLTSVYNSHNTYSPSEDKDLKNLFEFIDGSITNYCDAYEFSNQIKSKLSWINIYNKGDYQELHDHAESHLSCIYCVKGNIKSSRIFFKGSQNMFPIPVKRYNNINSGWYAFEFIPGTLYIFQSKLYHFVEKHELDSPRISLACNFVLS